MTASFGIDHPLFAVHDIAAFRARLIALGFNMTAIGKHPWGTSNSLAMFDGCLLEIMGVYDDKLLDEMPAGAFRFGRHIHDHLQDREGIALTALHSTDSRGDAAQAETQGFDVSGHLEFGRDVTLPDGIKERTKTTLALLPDTAFSRLSFFLCQQHRPELIYVPEWLQHPNSVNGICGITILAHASDMAALETKFSGLYGAAQHVADGMQWHTANGTISVKPRAPIERDFGPLPAEINDNQPSIIAMDMTFSDPQVFQKWLTKSGAAFCKTDGVYTLTRPDLSANTYLRFKPQS
jgi:hypothetical protein